MILNERIQKYAYIQWSIQSDGKRRDLEQCSSSDQLSNAKRFPCMLVANVVNVVNIKSTCSAWGFNIYSWLYCFAQGKKLFFMCLCLLLIHIWSVIPRAWCLSPNFNGILKCVLRQTNDETWYCSWMPFCFIVFTYTWSEENLINHTDLSPIPHSIPNSGSDTRYKYSTIFNWDSA